MATRAPSLSNSCAAASPIPLLPPVIRIFLFASLPIIVTPFIRTALGSDDERSQGGRHVSNHAPTVASSVLNQDIAGRQRHLRAIVELERSEEHTSELQSHSDLVCRLLLEKKKQQRDAAATAHGDV